MSGTLADARAELFRTRDEGTHCPCCDQYAKRYKRKLNSGMARCLIWLADAAGYSSEVYVPVSDTAPASVVGIGGSLATLRHWGLVEQEVSERGQIPGSWRITTRGITFVMGLCVVSRHVFLYNNTAEGFSEETTTIQQALGNKFDYYELMTS